MEKTFVVFFTQLISMCKHQTHQSVFVKDLTKSLDTKSRHVPSSIIGAQHAAAKSLQSCPTLCVPRHGRPPGSPVPGILQARTLEWVAISFSNAWKWKVKSESEVAQSCPTLSDSAGCSLPGSSVHGIFQARVLEWGATAFSSSTWRGLKNTQLNHL